MTQAQLTQAYEDAIETEARATGKAWQIAVVESYMRKYSCSFAVAMGIMYAVATYR